LILTPPGPLVPLSTCAKQQYGKSTPHIVTHARSCVFILFVYQ
jgi:hypothetical protein